MGMHIWSECIHGAALLPNLQQHYHCNWSTLTWPQHATPSPANWQLWSQMMCKLFSSANNTKLTHNLGQWNTDHCSDFQWTWTICPTMFSLYHQQNSEWTMYQPTTLKWLYLIYKYPPKLTTQPMTVFPPATPRTLTQWHQDSPTNHLGALSTHHDHPPRIKAHTTTHAPSLWLGNQSVALDLTACKPVCPTWNSRLGMYYLYSQWCICQPQREWNNGMDHSFQNKTMVW